LIKWFDETTSCASAGLAGSSMIEHSFVPTIGQLADAKNHARLNVIPADKFSLLSVGLHLSVGVLWLSFQLDPIKQIKKMKSFDRDSSFSGR